MIVAHHPDVNPDDYCYDTGLVFGKDSAKALLNKIATSQADLLPGVVDNKREYKETAKHNTFAQTIYVLVYIKNYQIGFWPWMLTQHEHLPKCHKVVTTFQYTLTASVVHQCLCSSKARIRRRVGIEILSHLKY